MRHAAARVQTGIAHARSLGNLVARLAYRLDVTGRHYVPQHGPVLLAANHQGLIDGPLLVALAPRPVHVLAKSEIFTTTMAPALEWAGQIRLDYSRPDRLALQESIALLDEGAAVGVFPEGHRGRGDVAAIRRGLAYLIVRTRGAVPVVPVAILGTRGTGQPASYVPPPGSRLAIHVGAPWRPEDAITALDDRTITAVSEQVRRHLQAHVHRTIARTGLTLPLDAAVAD